MSTMIHARAHFRRFRTTAAVVLALLLGGCGIGGVEPTFLAMAGATATVINTDKLPTDFIAEAVTGLDCNSVRQSRDGGALCRSPHREVIERPIYCYRSLGTVNCYDEPDPYRDGRQPVK